VGAPGRTEAVAESQEVSLVDRVQHLGYRALDDLVFQRGEAEGPFASIGFRDVGAEHWFGPVLAAMDACVQALKVSLQVPLILVHRYPIDSRTRRAPLPLECPFERGDIDVMQQSREPRPACSRGRRVHTLKVWQQGLPALCLALRRFQRVPRRPAPSLHHVVSFRGSRGTMGRSDFQPRCSQLRSSLAGCPRR